MAMGSGGASPVASCSNGTYTFESKPTQLGIIGEEVFSKLELTGIKSSSKFHASRYLAVDR